MDEWARWGLVLLGIAIPVGIIAAVFGLGAAAVAIGNAVEHMEKRKQEAGKNEHI